MVGGNFEATFVIFKNAADCMWRSVQCRKSVGSQFRQQVHDSITSRSAEERAMYSASVVLSAMRGCILEPQRMGHPA